MYWSMDVRESIIDFVQSEFSSLTAERAAKEIGYQIHNQLYAPVNAARLILVYSQSDYTFTSSDLLWLNDVEMVLSYKISDNESLFFIDMSCGEQDYYISCAAIVKIFNIAFSTRNVFVFRICDSIALGMARDLLNKIDNNFVITGLVNSCNYSEYVGFFEELSCCSLQELPMIIRDYSPAERLPDLCYDKYNIDPEYITFLDEFQSFYGVDTTTEKRRYYYSFIDNDENYEENDTSQYVRISYQEACSALRFVANDNENRSSYDELTTAQQAEEKSRKISSYPDYSSEPIGYYEIEKKYSKEAFKNAEQLLKEILGKNVKE